MIVRRRASIPSSCCRSSSTMRLMELDTYSDY
jgi:hypothetical protein